MTHKRPRGSRLFTIEEANATLPLVRAITADLASLSRDVIERRRRVAELLDRRDPDQHDLYREELAQIEEGIEEDGRQLQEYVEELRQLGAEPSSLPEGLVEGLVDFPSEMDGRPVLLCWKLGEPEVLYWHETDGSYADRRPLAAGSLAEGISSVDEGGSPDC